MPNASELTTEQRQKRGLSIGFITALIADELNPLHEVLRARGWEPTVRSPDMERASIVAWSKIIDGEKVDAFSMAINKMGQTRSAIETAKFLQIAKPQVTFLVGIAGSLDERTVRRKDVIVGTGFFWRSLTKIEDGDPCPIYRKTQMDLRTYTNDLEKVIVTFCASNYENASRSETEDEVSHTIPGKIFTWNYVINSRKVVTELNIDFSEALCVEMEAGGFLASIENHVESSKRPAIGFVVRGISDYASKKVRDKHIRLNASRNAAGVAVDLSEWLMGGDQYRLVKDSLWRPPPKKIARRA